MLKCAVRLVGKSAVRMFTVAGRFGKNTDPADLEDEPGTDNFAGLSPAALTLRSMIFKSASHKRG